MNNNILKNIIFIPILSVILVNSNLIAEETEEDLTEVLKQGLVEIENIQNDADEQQDNNQYFKNSNFNEETLLQDDDKKEIRSIKAQEIGKDADLIFTIKEKAKKNYNKITAGNKKSETQDQNGMINIFNNIFINHNNKPLSDIQNKDYRQFLYLSLDWDENLLKKFKEKLNNTVKASLMRIAKNILIFGINIQIDSEVAFKTIFLNSQTKNNLYKIKTKDLEKIKSHINEIMNLRKSWQSGINNDYETLLFETPYKKAEEAYNKIKDIKTEIQQILGYKKQ